MPRRSQPARVKKIAYDPNFTVRLPVDLATRVRAYAAFTRKPLSRLVAEVLDRAVPHVEVRR